MTYTFGQRHSAKQSGKQMGLNGHDYPPPAATPPLGGRYQISQRLGAGGFGQTFLAQDLHLPGHPRCVVKQLKPAVNNVQELQIARRLFDTEATVLSLLGEHDQIPRLLAHFEENQEFYLAQELIEGQDLEDELALGARWSNKDAIAFLSDILGTLAFVHSHRVIHRDIKPANIIRRGRDGRIVLIDFGAVKQFTTQLGTTAHSSLGRTISIGTQGYMPTEQVSGHPKFSSDVYAVGMIAIQGLTGLHPSTFGYHEQTGELLWKEKTSGVHPALSQLIETMVRFDFRARYANASVALEALNALPQNVRQGLPTLLTTPHSMASENLAAEPALEKYRPAAQSLSPATAHTVAVGQSPSKAPLPVRQDTHSKKSGLALPIGIAIGSIALLSAGTFAWQTLSASSVNKPVVESPVVGELVGGGKSIDETAPPVVASPVVESPVIELPVIESPVVEPPVIEPPVVEPVEIQVESAIAALERFYDHVSYKEWARARSYFNEELAQTFRPSFFQQFEQVTVEYLQVTSQTSDTIEFLGQNTYYYPDGSLQIEERTFTLRLIDEEPKIVASEFVRITQRR
ncbi:MAG: protein kinase [Cyanobacteria bacterium J06643_4]